MKKAQAATEYLIILAVIIIIALIVVGVMGGIPGIGRGGRTRASAAYWQTADVGVVSYSVDKDGDVVLNLKNNLRNQITLTGIAIGGSSDLVASDVIMASGGTAQVTGSGSIPSGSRCTAGSAYSYNLNVTYTDSATGSSFTFSGDGTELEGTCAN